MPAHFVEIGHRIWSEFYLDDVPLVWRPIRDDTLELQDLPAPLHQPFGEKKSSRKFQVVSGRPHRDAQRVFADADLEGLFSG